MLSFKSFWRKSCWTGWFSYLLITQYIFFTAARRESSHIWADSQGMGSTSRFLIFYGSWEQHCPPWELPPRARLSSLSRGGWHCGGKKIVLGSINICTHICVLASSPLFSVFLSGAQRELVAISTLMLSSLVCPGWLESHPECPARYSQHLYSWITLKCWTSMKQISRFAWGGLTRSSLVLKQKRRNCHLDSLSWLNKLAERLTGPKCSSASHHRGESLTLLSFFSLRGLLGFIFACLIVFGFLPQYPVGSSALRAFRGAEGLGCHRVTRRGGNLVSVHLPFSMPSPLSQGETASAKWFPCLMRRGPKSLRICLLLFSQMANYVAQFRRWPLHRDCSRLSVVLSHPFKWKMGEMGSLHTWPPRCVI